MSCLKFVKITYLFLLLMLTPLGQSTPVCIRTCSLAAKLHLYAYAHVHCLTNITISQLHIMLRRNIISIQPVLHLLFPEIYKSTKCSSFKRDYNRNPFGGMSPKVDHSTSYNAIYRMNSAKGKFCKCLNNKLPGWQNETCVPMLS